jgi:hypothetical protein
MLHRRLVSRQEERDRVDFEKIIDNNPQELEELLIQKSKSFKQHNLITKKDDIRKDRNIIRNKTFNQLKAGLLNTTNKELYIKENRDFIKALPINDKRNLVNIILTFL